MKEAGQRTSIAALSVLVTVSCAHKQHATFVEVTYPRLQSETCSASAESSEIAVTVQDELGTAIQGSIVSLLPMVGLPPQSGIAFAVTDRLGQARLATVVGGPYAITVALAGFTPVSKAVKLERGCSGKIHIVLKAMI